MLAPIGVKNLEKLNDGKYVLHYKKQGGCIKYTKYFQNPRKLLKCIHSLEKGKYNFRVFKEVY